jgi:hypothetical protein
MNVRKLDRGSDPMSHDAYAGFLKLLLTPAGKPVAGSPEIDAFIEYLNEREPLPDSARRALNLPTENAA